MNPVKYKYVTMQRLRGLRGLRPHLAQPRPFIFRSAVDPQQRVQSKHGHGREKRTEKGGNNKKDLGKRGGGDLRSVILIGSADTERNTNTSV